MTPFPLFDEAAEMKAASASAAPSLESSLNKKTAGVDLWKTSSMALLSNGRTFGTALASTKDLMESAVTVGAKSFLNSSKVLNKTTCPSTALLAAPSSTEATPNKTSSLDPA